MGFGALVVMRGLMVLGGWIARLTKLPTARSTVVGTLLGVSLIVVSALSIPRAYGPKQDFLGALEFVEAVRQPGDVVVTVGLATFTYQNFYETDWEEIETLEELDAIRARAERTWLVHTFPPEVQAVYPEIMASVQQDFEIRKELYGTVGSGNIFVYLSDTPPSYISTPNTGSSAVVQ